MNCQTFISFRKKPLFIIIGIKPSSHIKYIGQWVLYYGHKKTLIFFFIIILLGFTKAIHRYIFIKIFGCRTEYFSLSHIIMGLMCSFCTCYLSYRSTILKWNSREWYTKTRSLPEILWHASMSQNISSK